MPRDVTALAPVQTFAVSVVSYHRRSTDISGSNAMETRTTDALWSQVSAWQTGIAAELSFWDHWIATSGAQWPDCFAARLDPQRALSEAQRRLLPDDVSGRLIVDVGAGPLTTVGKQADGRRPTVVACDPLMSRYLELLGKRGITPLTQSHEAFAEDLSSHFAANSVDLVCCSNALDHSYDPLRGLEEMLCVARPGGAVFLSHAVNEAENENYGGFHQWNFDSQDGDFIVWNRNRTINLTDYFRGIAKVEVQHEDGSRWIEVSMVKSDAAHDLDARCHERKSARIADLNHVLLALASSSAQMPAATGRARVVSTVLRRMRRLVD